MNLQRLEYFLAIVDTGTTRAAAEHLRIAQPALSRQLRGLERELGLELFTRHRQRLQLTPAGRETARLARELVAHADWMENALADLTTGAVRQLTVAASIPVISEILAPFIADLRTTDPMILTKEGPHLELEALLRGGADAVISPVRLHRGFAQHLIGRRSVRAFVAPTHHWARDGRTAVGVRELVDEHLIVPSDGLVSRRLLDASTTRLGLTYGRRSECDSSSTAIANAAAGKAVAVAATLRGPGTYPIPVLENADRPDTVLYVPFHLVWHPQHHAGAVIEDLAVRLTAFFHDGPARPMASAGPASPARGA
ncbi:LysR family transcriptional regulator [Pseudonocardia phyllosphaerae]|uniref:LysR family transcriptional regulator n=1 Tax=Pseudonocardia phyllosphaerae TaxID=3390502 RepID=UPI00397E1C2A